MAPARVIGVDPAGGERADACRGEDVPGSEHLVARRTSPPRRRMFSPDGTAAGISISCRRTSTRSTGMTASAPSGTTAPVEISIASPVPRARCAGRPAAEWPTTGSTPGVSPARTA